MGGSLSAAASQDYTSVSVRGLSEFAPRLIDLVADVAMNPTIPEDEVAILKQQHLQAVSQQKASPQFLANRDVPARRCSASIRTRAPARPRRRCKAMDRAKLVAFHRDHYRPNNAFLLIVGAIDPDATIAAAEKAFGGWARGDVPAPAFAAAAGARADGTSIFVQRPEQHPVVDRGRQHRGQAQRSALVRADAGQHDLRRRVQLAHRPQHPRGEGLHLFAAVGADRLRRRRLLSLRRRRPQRGDRRDADRGVQGDRQDARRGQRRRRSCRARSRTCAASSRSRPRRRPACRRR